MAPSVSSPPTKSSLAIEQETLAILNAPFAPDQGLPGVPSLVDLRPLSQLLEHHPHQQQQSQSQPQQQQAQQPYQYQGTSASQLNDLNNNSSSSLPPPAIFRALDQLDGLDRARQIELRSESYTIAPLTSIVTHEPHDNATQALQRLEQLGSAIPRRVCQFPFKRNDIVWVCRTCQADETCVLCHSCFKGSNHEGHDVAFYHAQAGGCCDCGDPDAWSPDGFCQHHGIGVLSSQNDAANGGGEKSNALSPQTVETVQIMVTTAAQWLVDCVCKQTLEGRKRAQAGRGDRVASQSNATTSIATTTATLSQHQPQQNEWTFHPEAASTSKSRGDIAGATTTATPATTTTQTTKAGASRALELGRVARQGDGIYLILHADDVHTKQQLSRSLRDLLATSTPTINYTESLILKLVTALHHHGQLVVWGTAELLANMTAPQRFLVADSDQIALERFGASLLERAACLSNNNLTIRLVTRHELLIEQRAVAVLEWCTALARSCDPLCQTVACHILPQPHLIPMLRADFTLSSRITKAWHSLLLTLLAVPTFKSHLAAAYCDTYRHVTAEYAHGMGVLERSSYTLSVQFLNRVTYVVDLVQRGDLLGKLGKALYETLLVAKMERAEGREQQPRLDPNHYVLTHRRYSPCVSDLKCVLNVKGMARLFSSGRGTFLNDWLASLKLSNWMDGQVWRTFGQGHVETEPRGWVGAFNASISLGSLFERLLSWDDDDPSPAPDSLLSLDVPTVVELTLHCLFQGLVPWHKEESKAYQTTSNTVSLDAYHKAPASLPYATVHNNNNSTNGPLAFSALPVAHMDPWSFHLPLHRFVAACLREVCRRQDGIMELLKELQHHESNKDKGALVAAIMELPMLVLSRAAQVRAGLWKRNGSYMLDQVLNYAEPPFCRALRDADVLLLQFATLSGGAGSGHAITLLVHRFGIFDFLGLAKAPNVHPELYAEQAAAGLYPGEVRAEEDEDDAELPLPWTFTPTKDVPASLALLEEFLHLLIVLISELPPIPPAGKAEHTVQAKQRLTREVIHRLASGPKTHSELAEVHHVLSNWDNSFLSEEGKLVNPDDATGAALAATLTQVAEHKSVRGKLEPNQWVLKDSAWEHYNPAFYHISLRNHQQAAEERPAAKKIDNLYGIESKCFCPSIMSQPHPCFERLRRDVTSDGTLRAIVYRTLHVHCRDLERTDLVGLRAPVAYGGEGMSETALARAVHLLTLGAFAWENATSPNSDWKRHGGSYEGSVFFNDELAPTATDWVTRVLLAKPRDVMDCEWYEGESNILILLKRLATDGESKSVGFVAQDKSVRSGAAWLCDFASKHSAEATTMLGSKQANEAMGASAAGESEMDRKKREAKARAMERMNAQAARFAAMMQIDTEDSEEEKDQLEPTKQSPLISAQEESTNARRLSSSSYVGSENSFGSVASSSSEIPTARTPPHARSDSFGSSTTSNEKCIPARLLKSRPVCIICNEDNPSVSRDPRPRSDNDDLGNRKRSRRRTDRSNALAFVGYSQPTTVLKGGGGTPPTNDNRSSMASVRRFVGVHVALCGHAVHSECCELYLATVLHRDDRIVGRREEFKCPLCQRLSNCLVPFIDVGVDWIHPPTNHACGIEEDDMDLDNGVGDDSDSGVPPKLSLDRFLNTTPWWVGRDDTSVAWDGQSAFVAATLTTNKEENEEADGSMDASQPKPRRRSVRPLRKKDLYAAWSAMMRTPRFIRRRQLQRSASSSSADGSRTPDSLPSVNLPQLPAVDDTSVGETLVWRRFMDLISDMANRADAKRLGEQNFLQYCGEFRHYYVEKHAHNTIHRLSGRESADWPACISSTPLPTNRRQELSREKLLSKLLMTIQGFTYSCTAETSELKRLMKKEKATASRNGSIQTVHSKFGVAGLACGDELIIMPAPNGDEEEGSQPFDGRLGKLRYLGLAAMAAAGAVSADLVQLVLSLPLSREGEEPPPPPSREGGPQYRAAVVFPVLFGHVLTHVVAAMCATSGRARARSDSLELIWPVPFSRRGSFYGMANKHPSGQSADCVPKDCEGFIKLGLLARILQVLLGRMQIDPGSAGVGRRILAIKSIRQALVGHPSSNSESEATDQWLRGCAALLEAALSKDVNLVVVASAAYGSDVVNRFKAACMAAADSAISFLSDAGTIYQILVPGVTLHNDRKRSGKSDDGEHRSIGALNSLISELRLERVDEMLESPLVRHVVANWFRQACDHSSKSETNRNDVSGGVVQKRLFQTEGFRVHDWPMESCRTKEGYDGDSEKKVSAVARTAAHPQGGASPMDVDSLPSHMIPAGVEPRSNSPGPLVAFSSRKSVRLIGGYAEDRHLPIITSSRPRIHMLPTSYTDLYAELGVLCPDSEQTALCLVCGEVLNANGKGECTKHSFKCGAGSCIFFLLQECQGLIMHSGKAVYVQSPYVDSHGETPQYRGRPLNLDLDRYDIFRELWTGHGIRQKVVQERGSARQVIITDFY